MKFITPFFLINFVSPTLSRMTYQLTIPKSDTFPYAKLLGTIDHQLEEYTLCHWTKYKGDNVWGTVFSYSTEDLSNVFRLELSNDGRCFIYHRNMFGPIVNTGRDNVHWLHTCLAATTVQKGNWTVFFNGIEAWTQKENKTEYPLPPNGSVVLGQLPDKTRGYHTSLKFRGQLADVYMWDRILSPQEITTVYHCSNTDDANVINWKLHTWQLFNGVQISSVNLPCGKK